MSERGRRRIRVGLLLVNAAIFLWGLVSGRPFQIVAGGTGVIMAVITICTHGDPDGC